MKYQKVRFKILTYAEVLIRNQNDTILIPYHVVSYDFYIFSIFFIINSNSEFYLKYHLIK